MAGGLGAWLADPALLFPLRLSLQIATATLLVHAVLGPLLGWALARPGWPGRTLLDILVTLPMVFPPIALGFFLLVLLGRRGWLGGWLDETFDFSFVFSTWGVLLASVIVGLPLIVKPVEAAIAALPAHLAEAARTLGHGEWSIFFHVILPNLKAAIATGLLLATARSLGEVGVTLMLGGNIVGRTNTISLEIYNAVTQGEYPRAAVLSAGLGAFSILVILILRLRGPERG
ncbi:molybdate ABC transporter permease subunit [Verticiella sediminum]|uniref:Molybdenum transport system permease n=1 Tax=Verticiella sediminum TaxID=1247510 RepID=A0A556AJC0_9BURK|nr:molybdate ABC transporter permease subunit [Verticiella sediminum]TSH92987.1 molybdate ABC transporter permease subunit [Verticiella sediminum]